MYNKNNYENKYDNLIYPLYDTLNKNFNNINKKIYNYSIQDRKDLTFLEVYSIDPDNCEDADDAFSIYEENDKLYLYIHIADPTEYIEINSDLFNNIIEKNITKYPSFRKPIHLMPQEIVDLSSLMENTHGNIKNAISVLYEINNITYEPQNAIQFFFSNIKVKKQNILSYKLASQQYKVNKTLNICYKISIALKEKRAKQTKGVKLNDVNTSYPIIQNENIYLYEDTKDEKNMKQMIAEFAIYTNSFIGLYLKSNLNGIGIFRTCSASEWLNTLDDSITGKELLNGIIDNGINASYLSINAPHDLVGIPEYCHFTSPIRRSTDCICHYLLKYLYFINYYPDLELPFDTTFLDFVSTKSMIEMKKSKKNQYLDNKFRLIQTLDYMLNKAKDTSIKILFRITKYNGMFLNVIICNINEKHIHLSYSLKIKISNYIHEPEIEHELFIKQVFCFEKFDENTIPELDVYLKNKFSEII